MAKEERNQWPGWETVGIIGCGGFGKVYEIERTLFQAKEKAALKVISIPADEAEIEELYQEGYDEESITATMKSQLENIVKEYSLMRKLSGSTNIVNCDDVRFVQQDNGLGWDIFIKMELLCPLMKWMPQQVSEQTVIKLAQDLCNALILCKKHGIVHRDIKPQNIFISDNGDFKLGDFGVARIMENSMDATKVGTYKYMAPEVYFGKPYGSSADIYSLGMVLYWMLNEKRMPFVPLPPERVLVDTEWEANSRRLKGEPLNPPKNGSRKLKEIVLKACAWAPENRFSSPEEMLQAVENCSGEVEDVTIRETGEKNSRLYGTVGILAASVVLVLAVFLGAFLLVHSWSEPDCENPAVCRFCGRVGEQALGHMWTAATCDKPAICSRCGRENGQALSHNWRSADCENPAVCTLCGAETGAALEHDWLPASCTVPESCRRCGMTQGSELGHQWEAATFAEPMTCTRCQDTQGEPISHAVISVEKEVAGIRSIYSRIVSNISDGNYSESYPARGITVYRNSWGEIVCVTVKKGIEGLGAYSDQYRRFYYFEDGELVFAYFEGIDAHRLYFYDEMLMRWRYCPNSNNVKDAYNQDFTFSEEYLQWEQLAKSEADTFA